MDKKQFFIFIFFKFLQVSVIENKDVCIQNRYKLLEKVINKEKMNY